MSDKLIAALRKVAEGWRDFTDVDASEYHRGIGVATRQDGQMILGMLDAAEQDILDPLTLVAPPARGWERITDGPSR